MNIHVQALDKYHAHIPEPAPGEHLWILTGCWRVNPRPEAEYFLDKENLVTLDGPGCFVCEELWRPGMENEPCPGEPTVSAKDTPGGVPPEQTKERPKFPDKPPAVPAVVAAATMAGLLANKNASVLPDGWDVVVHVVQKDGEGAASCSSSIQDTQKLADYHQEWLDRCRSGTLNNNRATCVLCRNVDDLVEVVGKVRDLNFCRSCASKVMRKALQS